MRLPRAGTLPARGPRPALRIASVSRAIVRLGRGRLRRHLIIERCGPFGPPLTEDRASHCSANAFFVSISRRARARVQCDSFSRCSALDPDSPPPRRRPFGSRTSHRAVLPRLGSASRSHAIRPALSFGRRHSFRRSRRARTPLFRVFLPAERPARWLGPSGPRGCGPAATPVHSTDVCCSRMLFSKTRPQVSANAASSFPTRCGSARFHAEPAHFGELTDRGGALSPPAADLPASL
jgi:hypothetical protein